MARRTKKSETESAAEIAGDSVAKDAIVENVEEAAPDVLNDVVDPKSAEVEATPAPKEETKPVERKVAEAPPPPAQPATNRENSVLLPMILGGLIAGGLGYGAAYLSQPVIDIPLDQQVAAHAADIAALQEAVGAVPAVDLTPLTEQMDVFAADMSEQIGDLDARIAEFDERLTAVEKQPSGDGTLQESAIAAFQRELDTLRAQTEQMAVDANAALEATREGAAAIEQNAVENARKQTAIAALARIQGALDSGATFTDVLPDLQSSLDAGVPDVLAASAEGVSTLGQLQADFPATARAALAAARAEGASGEDNGGFAGFLRNQLDIRSVTPKDGDNADAVLSRAEAALREGRLKDALTEVDALPDVAKAVLGDWQARAAQRVAALDAANALSQSLTDN